MLLRVCLCVSLLLLTACGGPKLTKVSGNVKYKGKPVANASVIFQPDGGSGSVGAATTDSEGNYKLGSDLGSGIPAGSYSVSIASEVKLVNDTDPMAGLTPGSKEYEAAYMKASSTPAEEAYKKKKDPNAIPEKYGSGKELKETVKDSSSQVIDFDLE
jgi:hypothetical protein